MSSDRSAKPDRAQFELAVREHHAAVYAAALRITRDEALALDATQQTFLRVLEGKLELAAAVDLQRWLRCAAAREALMVLRAARSRRAREERHAMQHHESYDERTIEAADTLRTVRRALLELPEDLRAALTLRFQEELTFAEIGGVLAISEPSAHQRVQRGLEKLRERLTRLGLAAATPDLASLLKLEEVARAKPAGLEGQLLSLSGVSTGSMSALAIGVALAAIVVGVGTWAALSGNDDESTSAFARTVRSAPEAVSSSRDAAENDLAPAARVETPVVVREVADTRPATASAPLENGKIEGRVVDEFGLPLENVRVRASSVERDGKFAADSVETRSERSGAFALSVPVRLESGQDYRLSAHTAQFDGEFGLVRVRAGRVTDGQRLAIAGELADRAGAWQLELALRDAEGRPIDGAIARVHTIVRHASGSSWPQQQAGAKSDGGGVADLHGEGLGPKLLTIEAREQGFAMARQRIEIESEGVTRREVVLVRGVDLEGSIVDHEGAPITRERLGANLNALYAKALDADTWMTAEFTSPGRFRIAALTATPHELHFQHERWSSFTLRVTPGEGELRLRLKRKDDASDVGAHGAEIHGELLDAVSGAPVPNHALTTWLERIPDSSPALLDGDWAPLVMRQVIAQTASGPLSGEDLPPEPPAHAFIYDDLAPGRYAVRVFARGYAPTLVGPLELGEREIRSGFTVRLVRGAAVTGVVRDERGAPVEGAHVHLLGDGELSRTQLARADEELRSTGGRGFLHLGGAATDEHGRFTRAHAPTDRPLRLYVLHPDREPVAGPWLDLQEGAAAEHELRAGARRER